MEVMIAVPLIVPEAALGVGELEARVEKWGRQVMRQAMAAAWAAQAALRPAGPCPACGEAASRPAGSKARRVETLFGPVALPRRRRCCGGCGRHYQPDDAGLTAELGAGQLSPRLRETAAPRPLTNKLWGVVVGVAPETSGGELVVIERPGTKAARIER